MSRGRVPGEDLMPRVRLFAELDRALRTSVVLWMGASPGAGKTALVASYLKARDRPGWWHRIDENHRDPATFFDHLVHNASRRVSEDERFLPPRQAGTPGEDRPGGKPTHLLDQFFRDLPRGAVVVLEDWVAPPAHLFQELLQALRGIAPGAVNVVVTSRDEAPPELDGECVDGVLSIIEAHHLRFSPEEALALASARFGDLAQPSVSWLHEWAGGWVAGFLMMGEGLCANGTVRAMLELQNEGAVFNYLDRTVFECQKTGERELLLRVAALPVVTPQTVEALTGHEGGADILARWRSCLGSFLNGAEPDGAVQAFLFSPVFRQFLLTKGEQLLAPQAREELRRRATQWLEEPGRLEEALDIIIAHADWSSLEALTAEVVPPRLAQGQHEAVARWFKKIPPAVVEARAGLCYWLGAAQLPSKLPESRRQYERAHALYRARKDTAGELLSWAAIVETIFLEWGDFSELRAWIGVGERLLEESGAHLTGKLEQRAVAAMFCALMHGMPDHPQTGAWAQRLFDQLRQIDDDNERLFIGMPLFIYYAKWLGELGRAEIVLDMLRPPPERLAQLLPVGRILLAMAECIHHWHRYAVAEATSAIEDGIDTAERCGIHAWDFLLHAQPVYAGLSVGDFPLAERYLRRLRELLPRRAPIEQAHYHYLAGWHAMLLENPARALEHLEHCQRLVTAVSGPMQYALNCIALAQVYQALGEKGRVPPLLAQARCLVQGIGSPMLEFLISYVEVVAALDALDEPASLAALGKVLALARQHEYMNFVWCVPKDLARICVKALESNLETEFVCRFIRARDITPDLPPLHIEHWPWPLKVYTLGRFAVVRDGEPLSFRGKTQRKPLDLLKVLIALGGRDVPETRLSEALWPDAEGDAAHSAFTTTLQRLRKLIGEEVLLFGDGRLTLDTRRAWVDVWLLQRLLSEAERGLSAEESEARLHQALDRYHGPLLAFEDDAPWLRGPRQRLRERVARVVAACGRRLQDAGHQAQAVALCHTLQLVDPAAREWLKHAKIPGGDLLE